MTKTIYVAQARQHENNLVIVIVLSAYILCQVGLKKNKKNKDDILKIFYAALTECKQNEPSVYRSNFL